MNSHDPSAIVASKEELSVIHEEIDRLPERLRLPLILCAIEGGSREEVATTTTLRHSFQDIRSRASVLEHMMRIHDEGLARRLN